MKIALLLKNWAEAAFLWEFDVLVLGENESRVNESKCDKLFDPASATGVLILVCSPRAIQKPWILFQVECASSGQIPVIALCHSGLTKASLPPPFSALRALDADHFDFAHHLYAMLAKELGFKDHLPSFHIPPPIPHLPGTSFD